MSESEKVIVVSNRGSLDTVCTFSVSPDLMLRRRAFLAELDFLPPANPPKITLISPEVADVVLELAGVVAEGVLDYDLLGLCNDADALV